MCFSRWWFHIFLMFTPIWGRFPFWLIFFRWVETTNQFSFRFFWLLKDFWGSLRVTILSPLLRIESGKMFFGDKRGPNRHVIVILVGFWCFHMLTYCTTCLMKIMETYQIQYPNISKNHDKIMESYTYPLYTWPLKFFGSIMAYPVEMTKQELLRWIGQSWAYSGTENRSKLSLFWNWE